MTKTYHYKACGLDNIWLENGFMMHETDEGKGVSFHDLEGLHRAIALRLVRSTPHLNAKEFRFLRKHLDTTQADLASLMGFDAQTIARWEKGEANVNPAADKLIRLLVMAHHKLNADVKDELWNLRDLDEQTTVARHVFKSDKKQGWKEAA